MALTNLKLDSSQLYLQLTYWIFGHDSNLY